MDVRLPVALFLVMALAGCGDGKASQSCAGDEDGCGEIIESAGAGFEAIRGIVVDATIMPVPGVNVTIASNGQATVTDVEGRFGFGSVEPGTYFLEFSKTGYAPTQTSVEVALNVEPKIVRVVMDRLPGTEPMVIPMQWDGFMACSWFIAVAFYTGCGAGEQLDDDSRSFDMIDRVPTFIQSELQWAHTQPAGSKLCMRHYASSGIGGDMLGDVCGESPLVKQLDYAKIEETGIGNTRGIERVVWVASWTDEAATAGIAIDQDFTVYTHLFHNFLPAEGWMFVDDGAPPVPPS